MGDERIKWRSRLDEMSAKASRASSRVNDEKAKARRLVQHQLDNATIREMELEAHIRALEEINKDIEEECKSAVKDKRKATNSCNNARQLARQRLEKYRKEKDAKDALRDELACVVKANAKQGGILERYTKELEHSKGEKKLKKERKIGRTGGKAWDVWVVQVCCELLLRVHWAAALQLFRNQIVLILKQRVLFLT